MEEWRRRRGKAAALAGAGADATLPSGAGGGASGTESVWRWRPEVMVNEARPAGGVPETAGHAAEVAPPLTPPTDQCTSSR